MELVWNCVYHHHGYGEISNFFSIRMFQILGRVISHDLNAKRFPYRLGGFGISGSLFRGTRVVNTLLWFRSQVNYPFQS